MRELRHLLDVSALSQHPTKGHPYFRTSNATEHEALVESSAHTKGIGGMLKVETVGEGTSLFLNHINISSKVYYKQYYNPNAVNDNDDGKKEVFKHKGIKSISSLSKKIYEEILKEDKPFRVTERHFKSDRFIIYASEIRKRLSRSLCLKRFLYNPFFGTPYGYYENKIYLEKKEKNLDVSDYEIPVPPRFIPARFWQKMVKNVQERRFIHIGDNPIYQDYDKTEENDRVLFNLFKDEFQ